MLQDQNSATQLQQLAAQRQLYAEAKTAGRLRMMLAGPGALLAGLVALRWPSIRTFAALYAIAVVTADNLWLAPWINRLRTLASKIQEMFDCQVLALDWNNLKVGRQAEPEVIVDAARRYRRKDPDYAKLKGWYPDSLQGMPQSCARIICQRTNCWWDFALRRRFRQLNIGLATVVTLLLVSLAFVGKMTMEKFFLAVLAPAAPVWNIAVRRVRDDLEAEVGARRLQECVDQLWEACCETGGEESIRSQSRLLQDEIYDHRRRSPLIPDTFYFLLRGRQELQADDTAGVFVKQFYETRRQSGTAGASGRA